MTRRLAAILIADMVGYSRLMGADEAGTLARLKTLRSGLIDPAIAANRGRIVKLMGDGMLAVFDSVAGAVTAAAEMQRAVLSREAAEASDKRIAFRIGIHLGDVIFDGDDVYGEGVNLAARLEVEAPPGGICLSEDAWRQVRGKVDLVFDDLGERALKNIAGKHRIFAVDLDPARLSPEAFEALTGEKLELPDKPSIAVLSFHNMSGDPEQDFFADGIAQDISTMLAKVSDLVVIAGGLPRAGRGVATEVRQVGRDLGVRYVLDGSVRKGGKRVRITAQLIDSHTGDHVWADRYDRTIDDAFAVQDEITREVVTALAGKFGFGEEMQDWSSRSTSFEVWEMTSRGLRALLQFDRESNREAQQLGRRALALDPGNATGMVLIGWALINAAQYGYESDRASALDEAEDVAGRLIAADPQNAEAHSLLSLTLTVRGCHDAAVAASERAIQIAPGAPNYHSVLAMVLYFRGRFEQCLKRIRKAMRLNPYFPAYFLMPLGEAYRGLGDLDRARRAFEYFVARTPNSLLSQTRLACVLAELGDDEAAQAVAETVLSLEPGFSVSTYAKRLPFENATDRDRLAAGLRAAGLPE